MPRVFARRRDNFTHRPGYQKLAPGVYRALVRYDAAVIWRCDHRHPFSGAARRCANQQLVTLREQGALEVTTSYACGHEVVIPTLGRNPNTVNRDAEYVRHVPCPACREEKQKGAAHEPAGH